MRAYLSSFISEFNFNLRAPGPQPKEDLLSIIQQHNILISQVILIDGNKQVKNKMYILEEKSHGNKSLPGKNQSIFQKLRNSRAHLNSGKVWQTAKSWPVCRKPCVHQVQPRKSYPAPLPHSTLAS